MSKTFSMSVGPTSTLLSTTAQPSQGQKAVDLTLTDIFLSGQTGAKTKSGTPASVNLSQLGLVPDPPGISDALEDIEEQAEAQEIAADRAKQKAQELKLQDYWKCFATFPEYWPRSKEAKERHDTFIQDFQARHQTHVLSAGERIHCLTFVVVCAEKVGIRRTPTLSRDAQTGEVLCPGQCVVVEQIVSFDDVRFLKLTPGAWVFDRIGKLQIMQPMGNVELGFWWYRVVSQDFIETRTAPTYNTRCRTGQALCPEEVCVVSLRCIVDSKVFLLLGDGRGWVYERSPPSIRKEPDAGDSSPTSPRSQEPDEEGQDEGGEIVLAECSEDKLTEHDEEETPADKSSAKDAVETGLWQYQVLAQPILALGSTLQGKVLNPGEKVAVNMRVPANGEKSKEWSVSAKTSVINRIWLRLNDGRGWIPKTDQDGDPLVRFIGVALAGQGADIVTGVSHSKSQPHRESHEAWMTGVA